MKGRDLIIYILENNLEDQEVFANGELLGFMSIEMAALKFEVGTSTIRTWIKLDIIPYIKIGDKYYIPANIDKQGAE